MEYNGKIYKQMEDKDYYVGLTKGTILKYRLHFLKVENGKVKKEFLGRLENNNGKMLLDNCCNFDLQDAMYQGYDSYIDNRTSNYYDKIKLSEQLSAEGYAGFR